MELSKATDVDIFCELLKRDNLSGLKFDRDVVTVENEIAGTLESIEGAANYVLEFGIFSEIKSVLFRTEKIESLNQIYEAIKVKHWHEQKKFS